MKILALWLALLAAGTSVSAQTTPSAAIRALTIGDTVPDIEFTNLINYHSKTARLSDFKGKLVIIDFFATWCGPCIAALPKLQALQQKNKDAMEIVVMSYEPAAVIKSFLSKNKTGASIHLPFVTADTVFGKLFPHKMVPHEVWIDGDRKVRAITSAAYLTQENVIAAINGKPIVLPLKKDILDFDIKKPLLENGNGGNISTILERSILTRYLNGMPTRDGILKDSLHVKMYYINLPLLHLYQAVLNFPNNRIVLEVHNPTDFIAGQKPTDAWNEENLYAFEIIRPAQTPIKQMHKEMLQSLNIYSGFYGRMERRKMLCWALVKKGYSQKQLTSKGGKEICTLSETGTERILKCQPVNELIRALNTFQQPSMLHPIIVDATGISDLIDITIPTDSIGNISRLRSVLQPYGLDLVKEERWLDMFVLSSNEPEE